MTFRTLSIDKQFATEYNFKFKNLVVSGCSFTYNNLPTTACSWPYYLRDLGGFDQVLDTSLPGGGNYHIAQSLHWAIEHTQPRIADSLVIVMWSGNDRDDSIVNSNFIKPDYLNGNIEYNYAHNVSSAVTGGTQGESNLKLNFFKDLNYIKSKQSKAIENYLQISSLNHYLRSQGFRFIFLNYLNTQTPNRSSDFDIKPLLPKNLQTKYQNMFVQMPDIYTWCLKNGFLADDDFHPTPNGHLAWTRQVLIPMLQSIL